MKHYYLNTDPITAYKRISKAKNYVDKTGLIDFINKMMESENQLALVSRPRRFGKTYAAIMLKAYYTIGYDTTDLFKDKIIRQLDPGLTNKGEFDVIYIDMLRVRSFAKGRQKEMDEEAATKRKKSKRLDWIDFLEKSIAQEIADLYGNDVIDKGSLAKTLVNTVEKIIGSSSGSAMSGTTSSASQQMTLTPGTTTLRCSGACSKTRRSAQQCSLPPA